MDVETYATLIIIGGVLMLIMGLIPGTFKPGSRIVCLLAAALGIGYGIYLNGASAGTYRIYAWLLILPILFVIQGIKGLRETSAKKRAGAMPGVQYASYGQAVAGSLATPNSPSTAIAGNQSQWPTPTDGSAQTQGYAAPAPGQGYPQAQGGYPQTQAYGQAPVGYPAPAGFGAAPQGYAAPAPTQGYAAPAPSAPAPSGYQAAPYESASYATPSNETPIDSHSSTLAQSGVKCRKCKTMLPYSGATCPNCGAN